MATISGVPKGIKVFVGEHVTPSPQIRTEVECPQVVYFTWSSYRYKQKEEIRVTHRLHVQALTLVVLQIVVRLVRHAGHHSKRQPTVQTTTVVLEQPVRC